jgi:hypothetical protein
LVVFVIRVEIFSGDLLFECYLIGYSGDFYGFLENTCVFRNFGHEDLGFVSHSGIKIFNFILELVGGFLEGVLEKHFDFHEVILSLIDCLFKFVFEMVDLEGFIWQTVELVDFVLLQTVVFLYQINTFLFSQ